jgi:hypothetical protein
MRAGIGRSSSFENAGRPEDMMAITLLRPRRGPIEICPADIEAISEAAECHGAALVLADLADDPYACDRDDAENGQPCDCEPETWSRILKARPNA